MRLSPVLAATSIAMLGGILSAHLLGWMGGGAARTGSNSTAASNAMVPVRDDSRLAAALAGIERRLDLIELRLGANEASHSPVLTPSSVLEATPPNLEEAQGEDSKIKTEIERRLRSESRDPAWSSATEELLKRAAKKAAGKRGTYAISELSCLTTVCRIEFLLPNLNAPQRAMNAFPLMVEGMAGYHYTQPLKGADGKYRVTYEFFRKGYPTPGE
jgi:hypothetical protein